MKNNNLKLSNYQLNFFEQIKSEAKAIKNSVLFYLPVKKFNVLNVFYLKHILSYTQNIWAVGFRPLLKQMNFVLS